MWLPADGASDQREVQALRKELQQAQELGEAYARELAAQFGAQAQGEPPASTLPIGGDAARVETLIAMAASLARNLMSWSEAFRRDIEKLPSPHLEQFQDRLRRAQDSLSLLQGLAEIEVEEEQVKVQVSDLIRRAQGVCIGRAKRAGVAMVIESSDSRPRRLPPRSVTLLLQALMEHCIDASPKGGGILLCTVPGPPVGIELFDDGPVIPAASRRGFLERRIDPTSLGRPDGIQLLVASALCSYFSIDLELGSHEGRSRFRLLFP